MNIPKVLEAGANTATIALVCVFGWAMFHGSTAYPVVANTRATARQAEGPKPGTDLSRALETVNWSANRQTLVLGLQTGCHFCTESAPFFRELVGSAPTGIKIVAVLPQNEKEANEYLAKLGVRGVEVVRNATLSDIGVAGTPTILLVNSKGVVINAWMGKLPTDRQAEVLAAIGAKQGSPTS